jgi:hypothetical protein
MIYISTNFNTGVRWRVNLRCFCNFLDIESSARLAMKTTGLPGIIGYRCVAFSGSKVPADPPIHALLVFLQHMFYCSPTQYNPVPYNLLLLPAANSQDVNVSHGQGYPSPANSYRPERCPLSVWHRCSVATWRERSSNCVWGNSEWGRTRVN